MNEVSNNRWLHRFAVLTALATLGLIGIGGLVTSHEAGMSVPDWPNSYGYNMFLFPPSKWIGGILYEHTHRLLASTVGLLIVALTRWLGGRGIPADPGHRRRAGSVGRTDDFRTLADPESNRRISHPESAAWFCWQLWFGSETKGRRALSRNSVGSPLRSSRFKACSADCASYFSKTKSEFFTPRWRNFSSCSCARLRYSRANGG